MSDAPISARRAPSIIAAAGRVILWSGLVPRKDTEEGRSDGAIYDPTTDRWSLLPATRLAPRVGSLIAWTGHSMLVWAGCCLADEVPYRDGALFTPDPPTPEPDIRP
jgi:hypothetical protein